jgi:hypothetical protein
MGRAPHVGLDDGIGRRARRGLSAEKWISGSSVDDSSTSPGSRTKLGAAVRGSSAGRTTVQNRPHGLGQDLLVPTPAWIVTLDRHS